MFDIGFWEILLIGVVGLLVVGPEHARIFREAGWSREQVVERLRALSARRGADLMRGADGMAEGLPLPEQARDAEIPKFREGIPLLVHAGGGAGLFSAICAGWTGGRFREESRTVTREVAPWR